VRTRRELFTAYGSGIYHAGEGHAELHSRLFGRDGSESGILFAHGAGNSGLSALTPGNFHRYNARALGARWPVIAADLGGTSTFGNDTFIDRCAEARTFLEASIGADSDGGLFLVGASMGTTICNYARQHLADVKAIALLLGPPDFEAARATNRQSLQAPIEAAYGNNAGWQAARPTHNPLEFADELAGIPIKCWYGDVDTTVLPSEVEAFAAASGAELREVPGEHATAVIPTDEVLAFLAAHA
jgi:Alpha/beta hydrolase family